MSLSIQVNISLIKKQITKGPPNVGPARLTVFNESKLNFSEKK